MTTDLVLAAHGSADPGFNAVLESLAGQLAQRRPDIDVAVGYLGHGSPLDEVARRDSVVVPVFLSRGFHVRRDVPRKTAGSIIAAAVGPDRRIAEILARRLREAGWSDGPVVLAAAGSANPAAIADVRRAARDLAGRLGVNVSAGFLSAGVPRLADTAPAAVASYLLAPGHFANLAARCGAPVVAQPLGADPVLVDVVLDRYDAALTWLQEVVA
ncbi:MAG TPA: CbiX/SirB N-terminal domain-containing protein [Mycobacteriales bacterium]|nr:CbiX/SirB N-terminal domain-containing protein [Mycobacteriales bacterium]